MFGLLFNLSEFSLIYCNAFQFYIFFHYLPVSECVCTCVCVCASIVSYMEPDAKVMVLDERFGDVLLPPSPTSRVIELVGQGNVMVLEGVRGNVMVLDRVKGCWMALKSVRSFYLVLESVGVLYMLLDSINKCFVVLYWVKFYCKGVGYCLMFFPPYYILFERYYFALNGVRSYWKEVYLH